MPTLLTMPKLSPTMESGTLVKWHKKVGDFVKDGEVLFEVATDKATVEYQAIDKGWLRKIIIEEGKDAVVNEPVALFTDDAKENIEGFNLPKSAEKVEEKKGERKEEIAGQKSDKNVGGVMSQPAFVPEAPLAGYEFPFPSENFERLLASPLAKKLSKEKGLDLTTVKGTGPQGRIMSRDLDKAQSSGLVNFGHREVPTEQPGAYDEVPLTPIRKVIGQRLQESKTFIPHFYVRQEINADSLVELREQLKKGDIKVSINDFIVRACAIALKKHPEINRGFNSVKQAIIQFKTIDIAVAVGMEEGLITPIIRHADYKNLGEISVEMKELAQRGRLGKLEAHEYKGGSFTISNLGMYGINDFQAIINPPQAAILAVGGIQELPAIRRGAVVVGKVMNLILSVDHRVIDGVHAATFLRTLKELLENPALMII